MTGKSISSLFAPSHTREKSRVNIQSPIYSTSAFDPQSGKLGKTPPDLPFRGEEQEPEPVWVGGPPFRGEI